MLPRCESIYLSIIPREVEGDAFFPEFEGEFELVGRVLKEAEFEVMEYRRKGACGLDEHLASPKRVA
jgi:hypothetical protein